MPGGINGVFDGMLGPYGISKSAERLMTELFECKDCKKHYNEIRDERGDIRQNDIRELIRTSFAGFDKALYVKLTPMGQKAAHHAKSRKVHMPGQNSSLFKY